MAIEPGLFTPYHISDIKQGAIFKNGKRTFRGFGSDTTDRTDNILYIGSPALQRVIALKAFIETYKLNLTKETEIKKEIDKQSHIYTEFLSDISFDITLNLPAHSVNESRNNLAKLEELQRLIGILGGPQDVNPHYGTKNNYFSVWFKNLIHSGLKFSSYPTPQTITNEDLMKFGFMCWIDSVNYEPDFEAGFFDYDDVEDRKLGSYLFPRNIKLSLKLNFGVEFSRSIRQRIQSITGNVARPLYAFQSNGHYTIGDNGGFPFGIITGTKGFEETLISKADFDTDDMNKLDYQANGTRTANKSSLLFISMNIPENKTPDSLDYQSERRRWVKFKGFIESFNREYKVNTPIIDGDKSRILGKPMDFDKEVTFDVLDYSMKINAPAASVYEAKQNCAKIQYLMRMFFKKEAVTDAGGDASRHSLRVYSPSFIESPSTTTYYATDFKTMYANSLQLFLIDFGIDIDIEAGFFEEKGKLWPKAFSLNFKFSYMSGDLINNYAVTSEGFKMLPSSNPNYKGKEHLFPFPRQTSKIKIGG